MLVVVSHINQSEIHCINPNCHRPYPQPWGNRFCSSCGSPLRLLDRYVPLRQLGTGGFAQIYTVWDSHTQTEKVLKVLLQTSPKALELFVQEAKVLANLNHPGVPQVDTDGYFQVHFSDPSGQVDLPCLVMEKINGLTLEEIQKQYPQGCPPEMVLNWSLQTVDILQHLHQRHIIHRDIKPSNLMLRNSSPSGSVGELVLIDFGGVKQFREVILWRQTSSTRLFSSGYSPPEQIGGTHVGVQADFYALGMTMIVLLTGKEPSELENPLNGEFNWLPALQKTSNTDINPKLVNLLNEMVEQDAKLRPANAEIIHKRLTKIVNQSPATQVLPAIKLNLQKAIAQFIQAIANAIFYCGKVCLRTIQACVYTIWAMILTTMGAGFGIFTGFLVLERTLWDEQITRVAYQMIPVLATETQTSLGSEMILFMGAGLGTAWGLTTAGVFGQRRRYFIASLMGVMGYGLGYFVWQLMEIQYDSSTGILGGVLVAISLVTLGLGLRSHYIVHAIVAAYGTTMGLSLAINLGVNILNLSDPLKWGDLWPSFIFFGLGGISISFWLAVSYYLVVPILRLIGWR